VDIKKENNMKNKTGIAVLFVMLSLVFAGCENPTAQLKVFSTAPSISLAVEDGALSYTLTASNPAADDYYVYWIAGDESAAATIIKEVNYKGSGVGLSGTIDGLTNDQIYSVVVMARKAGYEDKDSAVVKKAPKTSFVAVTGISGVPTSATAGTSLPLIATVSPANATNQAIIWSVKSDGSTGATISGNTLNTTAAGTVVVTAAIVNGARDRTSYV
jgi:uncharacterized protein YjdB